MRWSYLLLVLLLCWLSYRFGLNERRRATKEEVVAWANGLPVTRAFLDQLNSLHQREALELALEYRLVEDAAQLKRIEVGEQELNLLCQHRPDDLDPIAFRSVQRFLLLSKKLVLSRYTPQEKRQFWEAFRDDFTLYKLRLIVFRNQTELDGFWDERPASGNFRTLARRYNVSSDLALREGGIVPRDLTSLRNLLGPAVAECLQTTPVGSVTPALQSKVGVIVALVEKKSDSYEDALPALEQVLFEGGRARLSYDLRNQADITTNFRLAPLSPSGSSFLNPLIGSMESFNQDWSLPALATGQALPFNILPKPQHKPEPSPTPKT